MPSSGQYPSEGEALRERARKIGLTDVEISRQIGLYQKTVAHVWAGTAPQRNLGAVKHFIEARERDVLAHLAPLHPATVLELSTVALCPERKVAA
jgi:predicted transcriptional regulator